MNIHDAIDVERVRGKCSFDLLHAKTLLAEALEALDNGAGEHVLRDRIERAQERVISSRTRLNER